MIKFFRNIRKNLLNEGKTSKYFKYAIGEIVLVVIGILIALQINNWNESRKDKNVEHNYLLRLLNDIENDTKTLEYSRRLSKIRLNQIDLLNNAIENPNLVAENESQIIESIEKVTWRSYLSLSRIVYNELLNSGKMSLIQSENLRGSLAKYYNDADHWEMILNLNDGQKEFSKTTAGLLSKQILTAIENSESTDSIISLNNLNSDNIDLEFKATKAERIVLKLSSMNEAVKWLPKIYHYHVLAEKVIIQLTGQNKALNTLIQNELDNSQF